MAGIVDIGIIQIKPADWFDRPAGRFSMNALSRKATRAHKVYLQPSSFAVNSIHRPITCNHSKEFNDVQLHARMQLS
jgi:hypothetical protein